MIGRDRLMASNCNGILAFLILGLWDVRLSLFCSSASIIGLSLASMLLCLCFILSFITTFGVEFGHFCLDLDSLAGNLKIIGIIFNSIDFV